MGIVTDIKVPNDAQFGLIKSLYEHKHVLITGYASHMLLLYVSYVSTEYSRFYVALMVLTTLIICLRYWDMCLFSSRFDGRTTEDINVIRSWETRYMIGSGAISAVIGLNAGYTLFVHPYSTAAIVALSMSFSSMISIVGRNFGSQRNVRLLSILNAFPCGFGMLGYGYIHSDWPLVGIGILMFPLLLISDSLASFVRDILLKSILSEHRWQRFHSLFDAAVSNLPTGMIMVDDNRKVVMMNDIAAHNLGLRSSSRLIGSHVDDLINTVSQVARFTDEQHNFIKHAVDDLIAGRSTQQVFETPAKRFVEFVTHKVTPSTDRRTNRKAKFVGTVLLCDDITERRHAEHANWQQARFDYLSGLPNRQHIVELMKEAVENLRDERLIAFCQFDVDGFKLINDTMGHEAGDEVIASVAAKMREIQAGDDRVLLARLGGDEFVLVFKDLRPYEDIASLFNHAFSKICSTYTIRNKVINLRCSGGVACTDRQNFDLDDLMRKSDYVLYRVKHNPKRPVDAIWGMFSDDIEAEYRSKSELRDALKEAIADGSISVAFQPVYRHDGMTIEFCEALVRWNRDGHGIVDPREMIKTAEDLGVIQNITRQVLLKACLECASWSDNVGVSVNFSALDLHQTDCIDMIKDALEIAGLDAYRLHIEVNESVIMKNVARVSPVLHAIAELGVKITIDEFGTGYVMLNYMHQLPLSKVKIDRSFIKSISTDERMRLPLNALIQLSAGNEFDIVVEGVETDAQLNAVLEGEQVDLIQGYLLGHPVSGERIREQLAISSAARQGALVRFDSYVNKHPRNVIADP